MSMRFVVGKIKARESNQNQCSRVGQYATETDQVVLVSGQYLQPQPREGKSYAKRQEKRQIRPHTCVHNECAIMDEGLLAVG